MRLRIFCALLLVAIGMHAQAQTGFRFRSMNYAGIAEGNNGTRFQLTTINGFQQKNWFLGLGTGIDYYYIRSLPLMLNLTRFFSDKPRSLYVAAEGGVHFAWGNDPQVFYSDGIQTKYKPRFGGSLTAGYKIGLRNQKDAILLNAGIGYKLIRNDVRIPTICGFGNCEIREQYNYKLMVLMVRVGWMF